MKRNPQADELRATVEAMAEAAQDVSPAKTPEPGPVLTCLADVEPRPVSWLWAGRIPLGRITLLVGRPGEGKSFLTTDAAARVTTGTPWPDGSECPKGSVILISAEDDPHDTIRPRLDAHYADARKVHLLSAVRRVDADGQYERMITLADLDAIEAALVRLPDCKLIVVDPIGSFLGGRTDAHRDNEVRGVLAPIAALAEKYGPAVLVVAHRRKSPGSIADDLALGSRAFTGIARAVWHLTRDHENKARRLLLPGKNNLAREGDGLAFSIIGDPWRQATPQRSPRSRHADAVPQRCATWRFTEGNPSGGIAAGAGGSSTSPFGTVKILDIMASIRYDSRMAKKYPKKLTDQLRRAIDDSGLTRYEIAKQTGIDESALAKFYNGHRGLSMEALNALGECLQLTINLGRKPGTKGK